METTLMSIIVDYLLIPKELVRVKSTTEAVVLVEDSWIKGLIEEKSILKCVMPENVSVCQITADLHHSTLVPDGYTKLFICTSQKNCSLSSLHRTISSQLDLCCIGRLQDTLTTESWYLSWKHLYLKHFNSYYLEDVNELNLCDLFQGHFSSGDLESSVHDSHAENNSFSKNNLTVKISGNCGGRTHVNCLPSLAQLELDGNVYSIKNCILHSVYDALMYSPSLLDSSVVKPMFLLFQLLKAVNSICLNYPAVQLSSLSWKRIAIDKLLWLQVDFVDGQHNLSNLNPANDTERTNTSDSEANKDSLIDLVDLWVCNQISNFDYLMHLNRLAGRRRDDPNHHPILPWVSDLTTFNGGWRDFTKSKYRLNKGDAQLELQFAMATTALHEDDLNSHIHVPHHVPDMVSDITFYVYKARRMPRSILQKHVRSYWEPNEYPSSIQRMQEWTPDECIPEFYSDPSIFSSVHSDMSDLAVPDWCHSAEEFVAKHMSMLESDYVSSRLHDWIDITFGYKLSGKHALQSLNVCRQLVDQHTDPVTHGIVQLFTTPHPQKRVTISCFPSMIFSKRKNSATHDTSDALLEENGSSKNLEIGSADALFNGNLDRQTFNNISFPVDYEPFSALDQLTKFLKFKAFEANRLETPSSLEQTLKFNLNRFSRCSAEELTADTNMLVVICLIVELFLIPHKKCISFEGSLSCRFEAAFYHYSGNKHLFPTACRNALAYLLDCLALSPQQTCSELSKYEDAVRKGSRFDCRRIFKPFTKRGFPPPVPVHLLAEPMQILLFPIYFKELYSFIAKIVGLTQHYKVPLEEDCLRSVNESFSSLVDKLHGCSEGMEILLPHLVKMFEQPFPHCARFLVLVFDRIAQEYGPEGCNRHLLPVLLDVYRRVTAELLQDYDDEEVKISVEALYEKSFLIQLSNRFGLNTFLESFSRLITESLMMHISCADVLTSSVQWLLSSLGPTLASKYIIRHLLLTLNSCFSCSLQTVSETFSFERNGQHLIDCLMYAASLYGTSLLTLQYIPHVSFSVSSAISGTSFNARSYSALIAGATLLVSIVPFITDHTLMDQLNRLSKEILLPLIGLVSSLRVRFPGGGEARKYLCVKTIDLLVAIACRIGREMAQQHLTELLRSFFNNFSSYNELAEVPLDEDRYSDEDGHQFDDVMIVRNSWEPVIDSIAAAVEQPDENLPELNQKVEEKSFRKRSFRRHLSSIDEKARDEIQTEVELTFCAETAYLSYVPFSRLMGGMHMANILENHEHIWKLSCRFMEPNSDMVDKDVVESKNDKGSHSISLIGNQLVVDEKLLTSNRISVPRTDLQGEEETHLKGNWLAYWEHEIGLAADDSHIHFNQIDLQAFQGHSSAVRSLYISGSEEWFMSGSKDKTVKIWSLCGASSDNSLPIFVYRSHKKPVFYSSLLEADHTAVSCDGTIHLWDPYTGQQVNVFDTTEYKTSVLAVATLSPPQRQVIAATSDSVLRLIDARINSFAQEYRSMIGASVGLIRTICSRSYWSVIGFSSGVISVVDLRMGSMLRMWQAHDSDISNSFPVSNTSYLTTSLDQSVAYWDISLRSPVMVYRNFPEPVHVVRTFQNEVLSATTNNRILVHALPAKNPDAKVPVDKPILATKLRSDCLRGTLSTFSVLPMKRLILAASESGSIRLLA